MQVINTHPDRETSEARLEQVKAEQKQLEEKQIKVEDKLDIRKKQFHVLVNSIHQLQASSSHFYLLKSSNFKKGNQLR